MSETNNRWYEFYFVRYFVGTVIGTVIIGVLLFHPDSSLAPYLNINIKSINDLKAEHFWISTALGLAYCYISSAPILVFHTYRAHIDYTKKSFLPGLELLITFILIILAGIISYLIIYKENNNTYLFLSFAILIYFVALQYAFVVSAFLAKFKDVSDYYEIISKKRSSKNRQIKEYVESYRHLREHGNALLIVFFEIALGSALFFATNIGQIVAFLIIWLLPSVTVWFVGTYLENNLKNMNI